MVISVNVEPDLRSTHLQMRQPRRRPPAVAQMAVPHRPASTRNLSPELDRRAQLSPSEGGARVYVRVCVPVCCLTCVSYSDLFGGKETLRGMSGSTDFEACCVKTIFCASQSMYWRFRSAEFDVRHPCVYIPLYKDSLELPRHRQTLRVYVQGLLSFMSVFSTCSLACSCLHAVLSG